MPNTPLNVLPYPALTDPADVPADLQALATKLDGLVPGRWITSAPMAAAGGGVNTSVPASAGTDLPVPVTLNQSPAGAFTRNASGNIVVTAAGFYTVSASVRFDSVATLGSRRFARLYTATGGASGLFGLCEQAAGTAGLVPTLCVTGSVQLAAGGLIVVRVFHDAGSAVQCAVDMIAVRG